MRTFSVIIMLLATIAGNLVAAQNYLPYDVHERREILRRALYERELSRRFAEAEAEAEAAFDWDDDEYPLYIRDPNGAGLVFDVGKEVITQGINDGIAINNAKAKLESKNPNTRVQGLNDLKNINSPFLPQVALLRNVNFKFKQTGPARKNP